MDLAPRACDIIWEWERADELDPDQVIRKPRTVWLDPRTIHFTHEQVAPLFGCGKDVKELAGWIWAASGSGRDAKLIEAIPPMVVVSYKGRQWSRSNRRLKCFKLAGVDSVKVFNVDFDDFDAEHQAWFTCGNDPEWFEYDRLDADFYPYSDCKICKARCWKPSHLRRHMALHDADRTSGKIVSYSEVKGQGLIRVGPRNFFFSRAALPRKLQHAHPEDLREAEVSFTLFTHKRGQQAWKIEMVTFPGLALRGKLVSDYDVGTFGTIVEYDERKGFGFIESAFEKSGKLFFHRSQLPFQLRPLQRAISIVGNVVEFKVVEVEPGKRQAMRQLLVSQPVRKRTYE